MDSVGPALNVFASGSRERLVALSAITALVVLFLLVPGLWWGYTVLFVGTVGVTLYVAVSMLRGQGDGILAGWLLLYPLGYYFLSFPREKSVFTLDRAFILIIMATACFAAKRKKVLVQPELRRAAICWLIFLFFAAITIPNVKTPLNSARLWAEALVSPVLLGWYVLRYFDMGTRNLRILHVVTCTMVTYIAAIGVAEVVLQRDLLPLPDSELYFAGDYKESAIQILVRPNGPFSTNNSFAMVGMTCFFLLLFLRKALGHCMPPWQTILHRIGVGTALLTTLLPLFRSVMISLAVILMVDAYFVRGWRRTVRAAAVAGALGVFLLVYLWMPALFAERSDPENLYGRLAQQVQTFRMFADHPILGVGLNNFHNAAETNSRYATYFDDIGSVDYPHNNLGAVLAETGLIGFTPFLLAQVFLFLAFRRSHVAGLRGARLAWKYFLFLFIGYWINGMSLTICYFADLNLLFMLVVALLYKYSVAGPSSETTFG